MRRQFWPGIKMLLVMIVITGALYPLAVTAIAQIVFPGQADGSLVENDGHLVGSRLIGQVFVDDGFFHPRPSAVGYDSGNSSASNLGPTNPEYLTMVESRVIEYRRLNGLSANDPVPVDAVTASASGLDPHISMANARLQSVRVAEVRGIDLQVILRLITDMADGRGYVNVLELNLALKEANP